jgi:nicotinamidase-related amidase
MGEFGILDRRKTAFVLVDVQEKFIPVIHDVDKVIKNSNVLIGAAEILGIPLIVTEQYPKGLGKTCERIKLPKDSKVIEKVHFSCFGSGGFLKEVEKLKVKSIILFGIEAHVCILNTALDALKNGFEVHVVADAVSSRSAENKSIEIERMRQSGAFIASTEMILFQLMEKSGTGEFRQISKLIK